ncbi:unnamed protein product [Prorocentrum cordatum]|uniref:Uncharacterized protein n=1 Tax=Prorocentrum cordatum TaxID=2364126 RepID=A0ABN9T3L0_9DINO|nr:unnamed protein product [Polarella glacialis]
MAAGGGHTVLLQSDGTAVVCGEDGVDQCDLPVPAEGLSFTQVAVGRGHIVLLKSGGAAVACGVNGAGQCDLRASAGGLSFTQVAAGGNHTVLLQSGGASRRPHGTCQRCSCRHLTTAIRCVSRRGMGWSVADLWPHLASARRSFRYT